MKPKLFRVPLYVVATVLCLMITLASTPSVPSVPKPSLPPPDLDHVLRLQRLAGWVSGRTSTLPAEIDTLTPTGSPASPDRENALFPAVLESSAEQQAFLERMPFGHTLHAAAQRNRVDGLLVAAVVEVESRFRPNAVSPKGAVGLMQLMPGSGAVEPTDDLRDPRVNLDAGSRYLGSLIDHFDGNLELALAAYNAGPAAVARYRGIPPFAETRGFVRKVLARYEEHRQTMSEERFHAKGEEPRTLLAALPQAPQKQSWSLFAGSPGRRQDPGRLDAEAGEARDPLAALAVQE